MTIVVTGAAGQLGREMCRLLDVRKPLGVNSNELDITDFDAVSQSLRAAKASLVINCAAYTQVDVAEEDAEEAFRVNALGPRNLAIATHELGVPLVQVSTDYVLTEQRAVLTTSTTLHVRRVSMAPASSLESKRSQR